MKPIKISIFGIDGSGKTSHINKVVKTLSSQNISCTVINLRGEYFRFISFPLYLIFKILGLESTYYVNISRFETRHPKFYNSRILYRFWTLLFMLDILILHLFRGYFSTKTDILFCDRCIVDSIVDFMASTGEVYAYRWLICRIFLRMLIPDFSFLFDVDENIAYKRGVSISSVEYLKKRRKLYLEFALLYDVKIIDTSKPYTSVHKTLFNQISNIITRSNPI